jgi:hypothetical protein
LQDIADELGVAKSSVSLWVRDIQFEPRPRRRTARRREPNALQRRKQAEIEESNRWGAERLGVLTDQAFLAAGAALYAGEGTKSDGETNFANSDPAMVSLFCRWLRTFFAIDESRLRVRLYLHEGLDLDAAKVFWAQVTGIPVSQFTKPYRAIPDSSIRRAKHVHGCCHVRYTCALTHRRVMGLIRALLSSPGYDPG